MNALIFALLAGFVLANIWVEAINERRATALTPAVHWWDRPLSYYLHGQRDSWLQSLAYLGFAAAELLLAWQQPHGLGARISLYIAAAALVGVVATANAQGRYDFRGRRRLHVICAGLAFTAALVAEGFYLWHTSDIWFPLAAAATAVAFARWAPERHALEEKAFTLWLVAGFISIAGLPL